MTTTIDPIQAAAEAFAVSNEMISLYELSDEAAKFDAVVAAFKRGYNDALQAQASVREEKTVTLEKKYSPRFEEYNFHVCINGMSQKSFSLADEIKARQYYSRTIERLRKDIPPTEVIESEVIQ